MNSRTARATRSSSGRTRQSEYGVAAVDFQLANEVDMGDYQVRAQLGETTSNKTVSVRRYVLPKFKADVKADKAYYMPKETLKVDLQSDYFFGKPVAGGKVKVTATTFDVAFKDFQTWQGKTDAQGHASFEIKLPDYFVGQPLAKGDAIVKLEVKLTDTADHTETITKTYPVSNTPVRVDLIPEGGRVVPGRWRRRRCDFPTRRDQGRPDASDQERRREVVRVHTEAEVPDQAQTPATVAYEYYTPANRATAKPVELVVSEK